MKAASNGNHLRKGWLRHDLEYPTNNVPKANYSLVCKFNQAYARHYASHDKAKALNFHERNSALTVAFQCQFTE